MNDNRQIPIDEHHDRREFEMSGPSERDAYARTYPLVMPATHELVYWWVGLTLKVETRLKAVAPATTQATTSPPVMFAPGAEPWKADNTTFEGLDVGGMLLAMAAEHRKKFDAMPPADLETEAGVLGVAVKDDRGKQRKKPLIVADMVAATLKAAPPTE